MITKVKKSRKEFKCSRCGKVIPKGSEYLRGDINFHKPIIRCSQCGLQHWEVTTSEYQLSVGEVVYRWTEHYSPDECGRDDIVAELESIRDEAQDHFDSIPESLQDGDVGCLLQERIDSIDSAIDALNDIDFDNDDYDADDCEELIDDALSNIEM